VSTRSGHVLPDPTRTLVEMGSVRRTIDGLPCAAGAHGEARLADGTRGYRYTFDGDTLWLQTAQEDYVFRNLRHVAARTGAAGDAARGDVRASMNGRVIEVAIKEGDAVQSGQLLVVIEAMKMEHQMFARSDGRVAAATVAVGDQVSPGQVLVRLEESAANAAAH
jgi:geranyl-CoA carboxylase alpha subunit